MPLVHGSSDRAFKQNGSTLMGEVGKSPHVKDRAQALAIAYDVKRRGKADGGPIAEPYSTDPLDDRKQDMERPRQALDRKLGERAPDNVVNRAFGSAARNMGGVAGLALGGAPAPWQVRSEARSMMHSGPINSSVAGRTDHHPMSVASGSYVLPADHVSSLGQGNTAHGMAVLNSMFGGAGPYGAGKSLAIHSGRGARMRADGGMADTGGARGHGDHRGVEIMAAGGEYVIPPHVVARVGNGDIKRGHQILDKWVVDNRKKHVDTLKKLPGPAKS